MEPRRRYDLEQRVPGERDVTAGYVAETRAEFRRCLHGVLLVTARLAATSGGGVPGGLLAQATQCFDAYFRSMKGGINLHREDVEQGLRSFAALQRRFEEALHKSATAFEEHGVAFRISGPGEVCSDLCWDLGPVVGRTLLLANGACLSVFPLVPALTHDYLVPRQLAAAHVCYATEGLVAFLQHDQDVSEAFQKAHVAIFGRPGDLVCGLPEMYRASLHAGVLTVESKEMLPAKDLEEMRLRYHAHAVLNGGPEFTALIHVPGSCELPPLLKEVRGW